ncbi:hypothetical protein [Paraherbaspirillum soli]|uniref:Uncharacterized protein n=1 Tax=Paraherbaspirillum soli TaxID=631222 RepID=A0ABW0MAB1_9BURK
MLTATYALLSLSIERKKVHKLLSTVQHLFLNNSSDTPQIDLATLESIVSQLAALDQSYYRRKIETYVIPAIRKATNEADSLLTELDLLSAAGLRILIVLQERLGQACAHGVAEVRELYLSLELYCDNLLQRLVKEAELLPLARRFVLSEEWFAVGVQLLSLDAESKAHKRGATGY